MKKIVNTTEGLGGITYDLTNNKLYFSGYFEIYRCNKDGSRLETVFQQNDGKGAFVMPTAFKFNIFTTKMILCFSSFRWID